MRKLITVQYECDICKRLWPTPQMARECEAWPAPQLKVDDVVLWRGRRDLGEFQSIVFDWITDIHSLPLPPGPGHPTQYILAKQYAVSDHDLHQPLTGFVNLESGLGHHGLHEGRIETAFRQNDPQLEQLLHRLQEGGFPVHTRTATLYRTARDLHYTLTWTDHTPDPCPPKTRRAFTISREQATLLAFVSKDPGPAGYLRLLSGSKSAKPGENFDSAFALNSYTLWRGAVDFSLSRAIQLLTTADDNEIMGVLHEYRNQLLAGSAAYTSADTLRCLFPIDLSHAQGRWPTAIIQFAKNQAIHGSGQTRLKRLYEKTIDLKTEATMQESNNLTIFDKQIVIGILSNKGGVGKSTISAALARALVHAGRSVLILDADFSGPSIPDLLPVGDPRLRTENHKIVPHRVDGVEIVSLGHLLNPGEPLLWRGPYTETLLHLLAQNIQTDAEICIVDLPPGTGDTLQGFLKLCPHSMFILVTTAARLAISDAQRAIQALPGYSRARILGIVENLAGWLGDKYLWGSSPEAVPTLARQYSLRFLASIPMADDAQVRAAVETTLAPTVLDLIERQPYQDIDPTCITAAADALIAQETYRRQTETFQLTWNDDLIASHLLAPIRERGGNPEAQQYRATLDSELQRVIDAFDKLKR